MTQPDNPAHISPPAPGYACRISLPRIVSLTVLSYGLYALYWTYVTWKQYRDHTGATAYPNLARLGSNRADLRLVPLLRSRHGV